MVDFEANLMKPVHNMPQPHGGRLVNRVLANDQSEVILELASYYLKFEAKQIKFP
jgi:hypothetical protein